MNSAITLFSFLFYNNQGKMMKSNVFCLFFFFFKSKEKRWREKLCSGEHRKLIIKKIRNVNVPIRFCRICSKLVIRAMCFDQTWLLGSLSKKTSFMVVSTWFMVGSGCFMVVSGGFWSFLVGSYYIKYAF